MKPSELKDIRLTLRKSQQGMADALGIALITYSRYERGRNPIPDEDSIAAKARKLLDD